MNISFDWENRLLNLALKAQSHEHIFDPHKIPDPTLLAHAYRHCEEITRSHSKTFFMASQLLPIAKRRAVRALYGFCRVTDDLVDQGDENAWAALRSWEKQAIYAQRQHTTHNLESQALVALAWRDTRQTQRIPLLYVEQLVHGVTHDLHKSRYVNFPDLASYCYGVACTVGLMSMHIIGFSGLEAIPYAIRLGVALQLTNILRDVGEDWQMGRLYLPLDELRDFGLAEDDIARGQVTPKWRTFMRFQIERVRDLYASAKPGIPMLHPDGRFAIQAAAELYEAILKQIEQNDYNNFTRRAAVSPVEKLRRLPGIWYRSR
jgi:phytoene synthase